MVVITESIAAATIVDFVVGDATSRVGWWSLGGQRAVSSARLSVSLGVFRSKTLSLSGVIVAVTGICCVVDNILLANYLGSIQQLLPTL